MNKLLAIGLLAALGWVLAVVNALSDGPIALTITLVAFAGVTQLAILGMIVSDSRPPRADG